MSIIQPYYNDYSAITNTILTICRAHLNVSSAHIGEVDDYTITGEDTYPMCFLELPIISNFGQIMIDFQFALTIIEQTQLEREDEQDKINNCWNIGCDIMEALKDFNYTNFSGASSNKYYLKDDYNFLTLTRFKDDFTAGIRIEFTLSQAIPVNRCILENSFDFGYPDPTPECVYTISPDLYFVDGCTREGNILSSIFTFSSITCPITLNLFYSITGNTDSIIVDYSLNGNSVNIDKYGSGFTISGIVSGDTLQFSLAETSTLFDPVIFQISSGENTTGSQSFGIILNSLQIRNNLCA